MRKGRRGKDSHCPFFPVEVEISMGPALPSQCLPQVSLAVQNSPGADPV